MFSPEQIQKRNSFVQQYRNVYKEMRAIETRIDELLKDPNSNVEMLEKQYDLLHRQLEPIICEYWHWLPEVLLSRCPICTEDFRVKFDPIDFHGFWWRVGIQRNEREPNCCPHFCLLTGAVDRKGKKHTDGLFEIEAGPEKPFVIPRVLNNPGMVAVWTSFEMLCGHVAHPIVYFSDQPTSATPSKRAWGKDARLTLEEAKKSWNISADEYDYELTPWIEQGKLIKGDVGE